MRFAAFSLIALIPGAIGYALGRVRKPEDPRSFALREHSRLVGEASQAAELGFLEQAALLERAAERCLDEGVDP